MVVDSFFLGRWGWRGRLGEFKVGVLVFGGGGRGGFVSFGKEYFIIGEIFGEKGLKY